MRRNILRDFDWASFGKVFGLVVAAGALAVLPLVGLISFGLLVIR